MDDYEIHSTKYSKCLDHGRRNKFSAPSHNEKKNMGARDIRVFEISTSFVTKKTE